VKNFVNSLPNVSDGVLRVQEISSDEGNVFYDTEVEIAKGKGWNVKAYKAEIWVSFNGIPTGIEINATNFPDTKFRSFVSGTTIDKDRNGQPQGHRALHRADRVELLRQPTDDVRRVGKHCADRVVLRQQPTEVARPFEEHRPDIFALPQQPTTDLARCVEEH
jgi:hypothetical protein